MIWGKESILSILWSANCLFGPDLHFFFTDLPVLLLLFFVPHVLFIHFLCVPLPIWLCSYFRTFVAPHTLLMTLLKIPLSTVAGWIMSPQRCLFLDPHSLSLCYLTGKRNFAGVIKLRISRWGDYLELSRWAQCNNKGLYKKKAGGLESERGQK